MAHTLKQRIKRFLAAGDSDVLHHGLPGDWLTAVKQTKHALLVALVEEVNHRANGILRKAAIPALDLPAFTRNKVEPMVYGLFSEAESTPVLNMLEKSVVFLTTDNINNVLLHTSWLNTAWKLANLYLLSIDAELLSESTRKIVGLSEGTTCYVGCEYFLQQNRFSDFIVHEAAHVFHNCRRNTVGLPKTRTQEFLLNIEFSQRETFAYACEVYSRILELAKNKSTQLKLIIDFKQEFNLCDDRVDIDKLQNILTAAVKARNGWKKILAICTTVKRTHSLSNKLFRTNGATSN